MYKKKNPTTTTTKTALKRNVWILWRSLYSDTRNKCKSKHAPAICIVDLLTTGQCLRISLSLSLSDLTHQSYGLHVNSVWSTLSVIYGLFNCPKLVICNAPLSFLWNKHTISNTKGKPMKLSFSRPFCLLCFFFFFLLANISPRTLDLMFRPYLVLFLLLPSSLRKAAFNCSSILLKGLGCLKTLVARSSENTALIFPREIKKKCWILSPLSNRTKSIGRIVPTNMHMITSLGEWTLGTCLLSRAQKPPINLLLLWRDLYGRLFGIKPSKINHTFWERPLHNNCRLLRVESLRANVWLSSPERYTLGHLWIVFVAGIMPVACRPVSLCILESGRKATRELRLFWAVRITQRSTKALTTPLQSFSTHRPKSATANQGITYHTGTIPCHSKPYCLYGTVRYSTVLYYTVS